MFRTRSRDLELKAKIGVRSDHSTSGIGGEERSMELQIWISSTANSGSEEKVQLGKVLVARSAVRVCAILISLNLGWDAGPDR
jgi:hypothetical protein